MKPTPNKILLPLLTTLLVFNLAFGQTINEGGKESKLAPDTAKNISIFVDSLAGIWHLSKTIRYQNGDTIIQAPSTQLWLTPGAKPFTAIRMDTLRNFEIEQTCMKCPYLFWKGEYEIEIRKLKGLEYFYLNFLDDRQKTMKNKRRKESLTIPFNGHLTHFENGEFTLTDKEGTEWIYKRQ